jgi:hypothetical protein
MIQTLTDTDEGTYRLTTKSGTIYLIDIDMDKPATLTRCVDPENINDEVNMRKDGEVLTLSQIMFCVVGYSAVFVLYNVSDNPDAATFRQTTPVMEIVKMNTTVEQINDLEIIQQMEEENDR